MAMKEYFILSKALGVEPQLQFNVKSRVLIGVSYLVAES